MPSLLLFQLKKAIEGAQAKPKDWALQTAADRIRHCVRRIVWKKNSLLWNCLDEKLAKELVEQSAAVSEESIRNFI
jgi:hypothetical protein